MSSPRKPSKPKGLFPLQLDFIAKRYHYLPSELMKLDPVDLAFNFDVATIGAQAELKEMEALQRKASGKHDKAAEIDRLGEMISQLPKGSKARKKWEESKRRVSG